MSVRLICGLLCIVSAAGLGWLKGIRMQKRIQALSKLIRLLNHIARELEFGREPLPEVFEKMAGRCGEPLQTFLSQTAEDLTHEYRSMREIFSQNVRTYLTGWDLEAEDLELLQKFGSELGFPDRQLQIHTVETYLQEVLRRREELRQQYPQTCRLCRTLGVSAGIFLAVLLW